MKYKCFHCLQKGHTFTNCSEASCMCNCVNELSSFPKNKNLDSLTECSPHFLQIKNDEVSGLIYPYKQISRFMKIRTHEQIIGKVDRRTKEVAR
jgi:hypothetical protein